ncbi:MAG: helix-turn-helix transcriptional regulator [Clostridia bacterium]|nr:helix-turn-helix transcriptional regulator [Clostridia bacterium]
MQKFGKIVIKVEEKIAEKGFSKNRFTHEAHMEHTQLNKFCRNEITQLDTDVLARICTVLDCEIGEILEFIPPSEEEK